MQERRKRKRDHLQYLGTPVVNLRGTLLEVSISPSLSSFDCRSSRRPKLLKQREAEEGQPPAARARGHWKPRIIAGGTNDSDNDSRTPGKLDVTHRENLCLSCGILLHVRQLCSKYFSSPVSDIHECIGISEATAKDLLSAPRSSFWDFPRRSSCPFQLLFSIPYFSKT